VQKPQDRCGDIVTEGDEIKSPLTNDKLSAVDGQEANKNQEVETSDLQSSELLRTSDQLETIDSSRRRIAGSAFSWDHVPLYLRINSEFDRLPNGEAKQSFAKAIELSFKLDASGRSPPKPPHPSDIENEFGFSIPAQKKFGMAFGKGFAFKDLLIPINAPVNQGLYKKLNPDNYAKRFLREPFLLYVKKKHMILTVAEWLHFVPYEFQCPLPSAIDTYLTSLV
jgi:hypothetical protein